MKFDPTATATAADLRNAVYEHLALPYTTLVASGPQAMFLLDVSREALYGGAAA